MKLDENRTINETTMTNPSGLLKSGKVENPTVCARKERSRMLWLFPVLSRIPPQNGESAMVSTAGMSETREISKYDACKERRWMGRNAQIIPVGPKARAVETWTVNRSFI